MTEEDFVKQMRVLKEKELEIKHQMYELQQQYLKEYPLQVNDKCVDSDGKVCWISRIYFYSSSATTHPYFMVNYAKKDGTRSNREQYAWGGITKVE